MRSHSLSQLPGDSAFANLTPNFFPSIGHTLAFFFCKIFPYHVCLLSVNVYIC